MDYRDLNLVTKPFHEPLPRIDAIKQDVRATVFSALDLKDAFHQVPVVKESQEKTVVQTPKGLYKFNFMPFGLKKCAVILSEGGQDSVQWLREIRCGVYR